MACILWVCVWSGVAMRQARQAMELEKLGADYYNNSATFLADGSEICYDVPHRDIVVDGETVFKNRLPGVIPVCLFDDDWSDQATINVLHSFRYPHTFGEQGLGPTLTLLYLLGCVVFYITISDSVSFMVDKFASNGRKNNHWSRRLLWACIAGALATTLLSLGSSSALDAVDASFIVGVVPFIILMCYLMQTIALFCRASHATCSDSDGIDYRFPMQPEFGMPVYGGIFNVIERIVSCGKVDPARVELGMQLPSCFHGVEFVKGLFRIVEPSSDFDLSRESQDE
jgi:BCCT, betaine/carnitine/choline family transporter